MMVNELFKEKNHTPLTSFKKKKTDEGFSGREN